MWPCDLAASSVLLSSPSPSPSFAGRANLIVATAIKSSKAIEGTIVESSLAYSPKFPQRAASVTLRFKVDAASLIVVHFVLPLQRILVV